MRRIVHTVSVAQRLRNEVGGLFNSFLKIFLAVYAHGVNDIPQGSALFGERVFHARRLGGFFPLSHFLALKPLELVRKRAGADARKGVLQVAKPPRLLKEVAENKKGAGVAHKVSHTRYGAGITQSLPLLCCPEHYPQFTIFFGTLQSKVDSIHFAY